jgi:tRNA pseudouridine38-40 synthase
VHRVALGVEYEGTGLCGWQAQAGLCSVEGSLEDALGRVADHAVSLTCGGRTDAGVHASAQVVHFDTSARRPSRGWVLGANSRLDPRISVRWACPVPAFFHARYSATARSYRYSVYNRPVRSALHRLRTAWVRGHLDETRMQAAAGWLVGEHDFSAFRAAECQSRSPVRRVTRLDVRREGDLVHIDVTANAFLHHMVRNIAGMLIEVGRGEREPAGVVQVLAGRDRRRNAPTAPAAGLCLVAVHYPEAFGLPADPL